MNDINSIINDDNISNKFNNIYNIYNKITVKNDIKQEIIPFQQLYSKNNQMNQIERNNTINKKKVFFKKKLGIKTNNFNYTFNFGYTNLNRFNNENLNKEKSFMKNSIIKMQTPFKIINKMNSIFNICIEEINKYGDVNNIIQNLINNLNGFWFVLIADKFDKDYEFKFTEILFEDLLIFQYKDKIIYISELN